MQAHKARVAELEQELELLKVKHARLEDGLAVEQAWNEEFAHEEKLRLR